MTKNLPLNLFAKHATLISEGLLGNFYDPQNTEDVKIHCTTAHDVSSNTVSCGQYSDNNGSPVSSICSGDRDSTDGWTVVQAKIKTKKAKESRRTKESFVEVDGIHNYVVNGNASAIAGNGAQHY
jgi:hypothetical protein